MTNDQDQILRLLSDLIECKSITPDDAGCQIQISKFLERLGFTVNHIRKDDVDNMIAVLGSSGPTFAFVGHTDVVPEGDVTKWSSPPFKLEQIGEKLFGRGTSDMKGSITCMLIAIKELVDKFDKINGTIIIILTSDEEGPAINGIQSLVTDELSAHKIDMCLVGEPSCKKIIGDTIKNGRRGSLSGTLHIKGVQGHIAYPQNAVNPIHIFAPTLDKLISEKYDLGNNHFPPTSFQISNINSGVGTTNIIPGDLKMEFNFRYSTETNANKLQRTVKKILDLAKIDYSIEWSHSGEPYLTEDSRLLKICQESVESITNHKVAISTDGGTSDGRFMAKICDDVIEFGLVNETIHKIDEHTTIENIKKLKDIYHSILVKLFT